MIASSLLKSPASLRRSCSISSFSASTCRILNCQSSNSLVSLYPASNLSNLSKKIPQLHQHQKIIACDYVYLFTGHNSVNILTIFTKTEQEMKLQHLKFGCHCYLDNLFILLLRGHGVQKTLQVKNRRKRILSRTVSQHGKNNRHK